MAETSIIHSPTFCPAPWTSLNIDQTGRVSPCMHCLDSVGNIKESTIQDIIHGPVLTDIREHMARGEWHKACGWCKQLEETTGASGRTPRNTSNNTLNEIEKDINYFTLEHIVVNWSNLCNLTCVYCNSGSSTSWQSIKGIPINHVKNEHPDLIKLAQEHGHTVVGLTLGGGEPLLQKGLLDFLQFLNRDQVSVLVTTNLSIDISKNPIYNELRTWPKVDWQISFDNSDKERFEYVRNGANWEIFVNNLRLMKQHGQKVIAHPAYSIYCAFNLLEYYDFCVAENIDLFWCELTHPWELDIRRYNKELRDQAVTEIDYVVAKYGTRRNLAIETLLRYRMTLLDNGYLVSPEYRVNTLEFHQHIEQELHKTTTFAQLWPQYTNITTTFKNIPAHFGQHLANQELEWLPTDTKENYEKLIQDPGHREYFAKLGWDQPKAITYKLNNYGFRADEFDGGPYLVALGCSYTIGIGLPDNVTWPRQTATALGLKCANLAWGGYSADSCFRLAEYWVPRLRPDYVCMLVPPSLRLELLLDKDSLAGKQLPIEVFMPQSQSSLFNPSDAYLKHWFLNDENAKINQRKNILAVRQLCADLDIPCTILDANEHMWWSREEIGYARDYMHGGPKIHNILTEKFINGYKK